MPLVIIFKLKGAAIYVPLSYLITMAMNYWFAKGYYLRLYKLNLIVILKAPIIKSSVKEMLVFSGFGFVVGTFAIISEFVCRSVVVTNLGVDKIGLYSPIIAWSGLFIGFLLPTFNTYLYPRFCEAKTNNEVSGLLNDAIRLSSFCLLPLLFLAIPFRRYLILVFYSRDFIAAAKYLPYHFIGVIFYVWWFAFTQSMTPTGRIKQHGIFQLIFYSISIAVTFYFVPKFGLWGWTLKNILSPLIFFIVYFLYTTKEMGFLIDKNNIKIMTYLLLGSCVLLGLENINKTFLSLNLFIGPLLIAMSYLLFTANEKRVIKSRLFAIINRKNS